mgnify:CR=1 FL=1
MLNDVTALRDRTGDKTFLDAVAATEHDVQLQEKAGPLELGQYLISDINRNPRPFAVTTSQSRTGPQGMYFDDYKPCVGHDGISVDITMTQLNRLVDSPATARLNERARHVGRTAALVGDYSLKEPDVVVGCVIGEACPDLDINDPDLFAKAIGMGVLDGAAVGISDGQHVATLMCTAAGLRDDDNPFGKAAVEKMFPRMAGCADPATCMKNVRFYIFTSTVYARKFSECCRRNNAATDSSGIEGPSVLRPSLLASLALAATKDLFNSRAITLDAHLRPHSKTVTKAALARLPSTVVGYWLAWLAAPTGRTRVSWEAPTYREPSTQELYAIFTWRERNHLAGTALDKALKESPTLVLADDAALVKGLVSAGCLLTPTSALLVNKACAAMRLAARDRAKYVTNDPSLRQVLVLVISALAPFARQTTVKTASDAEDDCLVAFFLACMRQGEGVDSLCMTLVHAAVPDYDIGLAFPSVTRFAGAMRGVELFLGGSSKNWNPGDASVSLVASAVYGAVRSVVAMAKAAKGMTAYTSTRNNACRHDLVGPPAIAALKSVVQSSLVDVFDYLQYIRAQAGSSNVNPVAAWVAVTRRQVGAGRDDQRPCDLLAYPRLRLDIDTLFRRPESPVVPYRFQRRRQDPAASGWQTANEAEQGLSALASFVASYPVLQPVGGGGADVLRDDRELMRRYAFMNAPADGRDDWLADLAVIRQRQWDILAATPRLYLRGPAIELHHNGLRALTEAIPHEFLNPVSADDIHLNSVSFPVPVLFEPVFRLMARMTYQVLYLSFTTTSELGHLEPSFLQDDHHDHLARFATIAAILDPAGCGDNDFEAQQKEAFPSHPMDYSLPWSADKSDTDISSSDDDHHDDHHQPEATPTTAMDVEDGTSEDASSVAFYSNDDDYPPVPATGRGKDPNLLRQGLGKRLPAHVESLPSTPDSTVNIPLLPTRPAKRQRTTPRYPYKPYEAFTALSALDTAPVGTTVNLDGKAFLRVDNSSLNAAPAGFVFTKIRVSKSPDVDESQWSGGGGFFVVTFSFLLGICFV